MVAGTDIDVDRMVEALFFDGDHPRHKLTKFWTLLPLAAVIASAGIVSDSTATVIGAMIVAPLMTPILGSALAVVLADRANVVRSILLVVVGALSVVAVGYLMGLFAPVPVLAATNSQVAGRVDPHLVDLVGALATGAVGAFALVRSDVSDTLPGVAIAISLVPPLAVAGLTLESGAPAQAAGAALLFGTNVAAIVAMGTVVFLGFGVRAAATRSGYTVGRLSGLTVTVVGVFLIAMAVPLAISGLQLRQHDQITATATPVALSWASSGGWRLMSADYHQGTLWVTATGPRPEVDPTSLRRQLTQAGLQHVTVDVQLNDGSITQVVTGS